MFKKLSKNRLRGFTLNELLVVVAIIGILASVVAASLTSAKDKARDAKKASELKDLEQAVELYFQENYEFPADNGNAGGLPDALSQYYDSVEWAKLVDSQKFTYRKVNQSSEVHYCLGVETKNLTSNFPSSPLCPIDSSVYKYRIAGP